jgi:sugar lactone lactonase YvrE
MHSPLRSRLNFIPLGITVLAVAITTGCGSSGSPNTRVVPTAAKNIYTLQQSGSGASEADSVLIFSAAAVGSAMPTSTLSLPAGFSAYSLATGPAGELYIGGSLYVASNQPVPEILKFASAATGSATPTVTLTAGQNTFDLPALLAVSPQGQLSVADDLGVIYTFPADLTSSTAPSSSITYVQSQDGQISGLAVDGSGNVYVSDAATNVIDIFSASSSGATAPIRTITGTDSNTFSLLLAISVDSTGNLAVDNYNQQDDIYENSPALTAHHFQPQRQNPRLRPSAITLHPHTDLPAASTSIFVFAPGATGNAAPIRTLSGATTTIYEPDGVTLDQVDNLYYVDFAGGSPVVMTFSSTATGNVAPSTSFYSMAISFLSYQNIAVF